MLLSQTPIGQRVQITGIAGVGAFRRRLMELGLVPGTAVELVRVAPLGDPIELLVRGVSLSIRKAEASQVEVEAATQARPSLASERERAFEPGLGV